jgi:hypothetical protein
MKKNNYIVLSAFILLMFIPVVDVFAQQCTQPAGCCPDGFPPFLCTGCPPCTGIPLDGGLSALLIAGVAFGAKKLRGNQKS